MNAIGPPREQVHRRRAVEREVGGAEGPFQRRVVAIEKEHDLELVPLAAPHPRPQAGQLDEEEAAGEREVLVQQAVALERARSVRQQRLRVVEAQRARRRRRHHLVGGVVPARLAQRRGHHVADQLLVYPHGQLVAPAQEQRQAIERQLLEAQAGRRTQLQPQRRPRRLTGGQPDAPQIAQEPGVLDAGQLQRPQRHLVGGPVVARSLLAPPQQAAHHRPARDAHPRGQRPLVQAGLHLHHRHRGDGRQVVRVDQLEQVLGEAGELRIDLQLHPRGQKGEPLQQSLHVGVGALERLQPQSPRDLGKLAGELPAHLPQVLELAVVVVKQPRVHGLILGAHRRQTHHYPAPAASTTWTLPSSRSISVLRNRRSGIGWAHSSASM